jgi:hypothetical protein
MRRTVHIIGNGDCATFYQPAPGIKLTCNMPAFDIKDVYGTVMVDFKMMKALHEGSLKLDAYDWILGMRPKKWMEMQPGFYLKYAKNVKEFYTELPSYVNNYTDFNCGHMATYYAANKLKADEVHMYGFDSIFDMNLRSVTDLYLFSDRSPLNTHRLNTNWRPIWENMFKEFPNTKFVLYHKHDNIKINKPDNVFIDTSRAIRK